MPFVYNEDRKGASRSKRFANLQVIYQKSNLLLVWAVAFLMFFYKKNYRSHSTDNADNSIYYRDNDTNDTYKFK